MDDIEKEAFKIITSFERVVTDNKETDIIPCPRCKTIHYLVRNGEGLCTNCGLGGLADTFKSKAAFLMSDDNKCMIIGIRDTGQLKETIDEISKFTYRMFHKHPYKLDNFILAYYKDDVKHIDAKYIV